MLTAPAIPKLDPREQEIKALLNDYIVDIARLGTGTSLKNSGQRMSPAQMEAMQKELDANNVALSKEVGAGEAVILDAQQEVTLYIPEKALSESKTLSVQELAPASQPRQYAVKMGSSVYEFGPGGTIFAKPVTISLKLPITEDMDSKNLTVAWYDESKQEWIALPGIIDLNAGLAVFQVDHFSQFALIELPPRCSFKDLAEEPAEVRDAIEILAGQGIIKGTGQGFEPYRPIQRAEFVHLLVQALGLDQEQEALYKDVNKSDWFVRAVGIARANKLLAGYPDNSFRPVQEISRYEIAVIMYKLKGNIGDGAAASGLNYLDKSEIPVWALNGVRYAELHELLKASDDGKFNGESPLSRAEAAMVVYRHLNAIQ